MKQKTPFFATALLLFTVSFSAKAIGEGKPWAVKYENSKCFIENKGQFKLSSEKDPTSSSVKFAYDDGSTMIYFTSTGVSYSFLKRWKKNENENPKEIAKERAREQEELKNGKSHAEIEAEEHKMKFKIDIVNMVLENANPDAELIAEDPTTDYHIYQIKDKNGDEKSIDNIKAYKKLIYKNIYPSIDIEYTFHTQSGIKYALILHPGADISKVKMKYSDGVKIKGNGDIHISTKFGDIIDHAPLTFYSENKSQFVSSNFIINGKIVSFELGDYDHSKILVIDPWTQTPTLLNSNGVWECEADGAGNVYIIGGDMPMKLLKYNSLGTLQWTYNTPWDTANYWLGTMATDLAGNSYITAGSIAKIQKINNAGGLVWNNSGGSLDEYWTIAFNCDQTKLIVGGTRLGVFPPAGSNGMVFDINTGTGAIMATKKVGWYRSYTIFGFTINDIEEVRSITSSYNARYYYLTLDTIGSIDQNFSACPTSFTLFNINDGYSFGYKCENYRPNNGNSGIKGIRANKNFVYTQNGATIQKRSLTTGAVITTAVIPGGISVASGGFNQTGNSGIDIDSCGNVFVGSGNAVIKYDANLVLLTSVAVPYKVYDVAVSYGGNVVICGATGDASISARTGYVQQVNMTSCNPQTLICCDVTVCPAGPLCTSDSPITLSPVQAGGTWSGTGVNPSTGVFSPSVSGAGTFIITYTLACGSGTVSITVSPCTPMTVCQSAGPTLTVSGGTGPYTWQNQVTTNPCVAGLGTCSGPFTVAGPPVTSWATFATGTTVAYSGTYPIQIIDNNGTILSIASLASIPNCTSCPTLTVNITAQVNVSCFGASTGSFNASTSGGATPWDYTLMNGATTVATFTNIAGTQSFTGLPAGTYTLNVLDNAGCPGTATITITQPAAATTTANAGPAQTICGTTATLAGNTATVGTGLWTLVSGAGTVTTPSSPTSGVTGLGVGANIFQWTISNPPCPSTTSNVTITGVATPTVAAAGPDQSMCSSSATLAGNTPTVGTGIWTLVSGVGTITTPSSPTSGVTGLGLGPNIFQWTISNLPCPSSSSSVTITNTGGATTSVAGPAQTVCSTIATLAGNTPTIGTGLWTLVSGAGTITTPSSPTSGITGLGIGANLFDWTISNPPCSPSSSTVTVTGVAAPTVAAAGPNQTTCSTLVTLAANTPTVGTGTWTLVSGVGTITTPSSPTSGITGLGVGSNVFMWTISNPPCPSSTSTVTITNTGGPSVSITSQINVLCFGATTGSATANASSGAGPYDYVWTGTAGTLQTTLDISVPNTLSGLGAGTYTVTITDNAGCTTNATVTITQPASALTLVLVTSVDATCGNTNGSATVNASGGTIGYIYSWAPSGGSGSSASGLGANTYTVTVTDGNSCTTTLNVIINNSGGPTVSVSSQTNNICNGGTIGSITINVSGGSGTYTYTWSGSVGSGTTATNLAAGTYTITVNDGTCSNITTVTITQPSAITGLVNTTSSNCSSSDGTASVTASGGTGTLTYLWSPGGAVTSSIIGISSGVYSVTITDSLGCTQTTSGSVGIIGGVTANAGLNVTITQGDSIQLNASGGLTYNWSPAGGLSCTTCSNPIAAPTQTTTYCVLVDSAGCSDTACVRVTVDVPPPPCPTNTDLAVPNAFSPNDDGHNDEFCLKGWDNCITTFTIYIYDRWGEKVFESNLANFCWDGTYKGKAMDPAVFVYFITATFSNNNKIDAKGNISLIR